MVNANISPCNTWFHSTLAMRQVLEEHRGDDEPLAHRLDGELDDAERRALVDRLAEAARRAGLVVIVCVGETREEREAGRALDVVRAQVQASLPDGIGAAGLVVAYEPVWAIGTGLTPTPADIAWTHAAFLDLLRIRTSSRLFRLGLLFGPLPLTFPQQIITYNQYNDQL